MEQLYELHGPGSEGTVDFVFGARENNDKKLVGVRCG